MECEPSRGAAAPKRLVVLDDDARMLELLCDILRAEGYAVRSAQNYETGLGLLQEEPADLVVTDLRMPGVDGASGVSDLQARGLAKRIIVVSGYVDGKSRAALSALHGVVGIISKPFSIPELTRAVAAGLDAPAADEREEL